MLRDEDIRAALQADAARANVPAREILARVKQSGARVRTSPFRYFGIRQALAVCAALALVIAVPLLQNYRNHVLPTSPAVNPAPPAKESEPGPVTAYESKAMGFRLTFLSTFHGPQMGENGALLFTGDVVEVSVARRLAQPVKDVTALLGDLVAETAKQSDRLRPMDSGIRFAGGRPGAYLRVAYVSAAAGFDRETYVVPAGEYEYTVTCATKVGERTPWATAQPICQLITDNLELATEQGFLSRTVAMQIALGAVTGEFDGWNAWLADVNYEGLGPAWRVELARKGEQQVAYAVVLDARTGSVHYVHDMVTLEKKKP